MFTARKVFSSTLTISAAFVVRPGRCCRRSASRARSQLASAGRPRRRPWVRVLGVNRLLPGSTRSGERARKKSCPASGPGSRIGSHDLLGRSRVRRGLQDDELAGSEVLLDLLHRAHDVADVGVTRLPERRRYADVDDVHVGEDAKSAVARSFRCRTRSLISRLSTSSM